ncbi:hypothetical protein ACTWPT_29605 [Nonomuraea sp. 3N208]|uniref:hypothetical protein n=1 Tax=Nonomuraea sp. 3N208 TaxID=3457421 RepID=UPI003FD45A1C
MPDPALATAALNQLKLAAKSAPGIIVGVAIATTALANWPGMGEAKSNWNSLAKALEVEYPSLIGNAVFLSRAGWVADDREAFLNAAALFTGDLQKLSGLCYNMEGQVDQVRDAYAIYWLEIGALAVVVIGYVVACMAMMMTPHLRASGTVMLNRLTAATNYMIAKKTGFLFSFLGVAAATLGTSSQSLGQLFTVQPTQSAAIDFERAVISTDPPSNYIAPMRELPAPPQPEEEDPQPPEQSEQPEPQKQPR